MVTSSHHIMDIDGNINASYIVSSVVKRANACRICLDDTFCLILPPFVYVRQGDILDLVFENGILKEVYRQIKFASSNQGNRVKVYPPYHAKELVHIPPQTLTVSVRERKNDKDWKAAKILEQFHYRGQGLNKLVGRRTVLLIEIEGQGIVGYGVLSATLPVAKPRFDLLNTDFKTHMKDKTINKIARIPRVVIHPEFRGLGLGVLLAKHLILYSREYWDINGYKPIMIEVIAAMTEYHKFFQRAGFTKYGSTLGYKKGIIPIYNSGIWEDRPNHENYNFFGNQLPKPYLVYPLTEEIMNMLREIKSNESQCTHNIEQKLTLKEPIRLKKVSVTYKASNGLTQRAKEVKEAFAVSADQMYSPILKQFSFDINPGEIVLFTGASGSGKSTIIKLLTRTILQNKKTMDITGEILGVKRSQISTLTLECDSNLPLIDQVGNTTKEGIEILNNVGLSEAHLYVKRCNQISEGQKYRFAVARLCNTKKPIWIADEFASTLDPQTAKIVARGIRKLAFQFGATVILAAPHIDHFLETLSPTSLVNLRWGGFAKVYKVKLFCEDKSTAYIFRVLNLGNEELSMININGLVESTGETELLFNIDKLKENKSSTKISFQKSKLEKFSSIILTTKEGVGDKIRL